jgi:hypothetical protein
MRTPWFAFERTPEMRLATKLRKQAERAAHRARVFKTHPPSVRYAKAKFKKGKKHQPKRRQKLQLGIQ